MNQQIQKEIEFVADNWFRDLDGNDRTNCEGISIGLSLSPTVKVGLTSIINYYERFVQIAKSDQIATMASNPTRLQIEIAQKLGCRIERSCSNGGIHYDEFLPQLWQVATNRISSLIQFIQKVIPKRIYKKKSLFVADFTTTKFSDKQPNTLRLFRKSLINGAFTRLQRDYVEKYVDAFPRLTDLHSEVSNLEAKLKQQNISWPQELVEICSSYILTVYDESSETVITTCAVWDELLKFYEPQDVSLPADNFFDTIILYQMCRVYSIKTKMYLDGYNSLPIGAPLKSVNGDDWLADTIMAYGMADQKRLVALGVPPDRIEIINPPFLDNFKKVEKSFVFDFIVCTLLPCVINPQTDYLSPPNSLREILRCLFDMGFTKIAVKIKAKQEIEYVQEVINELGINIKILEGRMCDHIYKTKALIGGISTTLVESEYVGVPYFVFEPVGNGYVDEWFDGSFVVSRETIARNPEELRNLISRGVRSFKASYTDLVDELNFN